MHMSFFLLSNKIFKISTKTFK